MPVINLGVEEIPYNTLRGPRAKRSAANVTTYDVANFLENRYHVMEVFYEETKEQIAGDLENSVQGAIESLVMGAPAGIDPYGGATSEIEDRFKQFLSTGVMETLGFPGVPTQAALDRRAGKKRSGRFKKKRPSTGVSFIDTGLYQSSFRAWMT